MKIAIHDAHALIVSTIKNLGYGSAKAEIVADHLIDCELRGFGAGGLARAVTLVHRISSSKPFEPIRIIKETDTSIALDGGDQLGYIVAKQLTEKLIEKSKTRGVSMGGARNTWCTGMFSYYLELITEAGLVGFITSSGGPTVAPFGGNEAMYGTNPVALGFPTNDEPVIWDIGTSELMLADLTYAQKHDLPLQENVAYDSKGDPTRDAGAALNGGAIRAWGGHRGSGLALSAQLLGLMVGSSSAPPWLTDMGFFMSVFDPSVFTSDFPQRAAEYVDTLRASRPVDDRQPVRLPFERSAKTRRETIAAGEFEASEKIVEELKLFNDRHQLVHDQS